MKRQDILPLSLDGMPVYSRCPPSPTFLQFSLTVHKWPLILLSGEGPGESKVPSSRTLQREFKSWHFDPESRVRSPGSGVQGPESGVWSPDMSQLISLWNRWTLLRWSKQTKVYLIPLTLILGTGLTLRRLGNFKGTRNLWVGQSLNLFPLGLMGSCYPSGKFWNFWKTALC